jgi:hypothetical protein
MCYKVDEEDNNQKVQHIHTSIISTYKTLCHVIVIKKIIIDEKREKKIILFCRINT